MFAQRTPARRIEPAGKLLEPRDQEHNLALRGMDLIIYKKLAGGAATEFLEFFCQLSCDAKLPIRHDIDASGECFR